MHDADAVGEGEFVVAGGDSFPLFECFETSLDYMRRL